MLQLFVHDTPKQLDQLENYINLGDTKNIQVLSHSLKSSSAIIGAKILSDMCRRVEIGARVDKVPKMDKLDQIREEFKRVVRDIKNLVE